MQTFEYMLILLVAVWLSYLISTLLPVLSAPIVQIILGVVIFLVPFGAFGFEFKLDPKLFFVLFIAPLVFHSSMTADKKTLWKMKWPILGCAVLLVIVTVVAAGYFAHALIPAIPLAAGFALTAALAPTDVVAVNAVSKRINIPQKIMGILSGESIINDATGVVSFQFAIAAMVTGSFSLAQATGRFLLTGLGGVLIGLLLTLLKYGLVRWLRSFGIESVTLHILLGLLTPFIIYLTADALSLSGILAVFASGIAHSIFYHRLNPETVKLQIAQESVWSVLSFTFDGLVFVILGTQLPDILKTINSGNYLIDAWQIVGCVVALELVFLAIRFLWWILVIRKGTHPSSAGKFKAGVIFSLAGAHGTVTLVSVMSIPLLLMNGSAFPERNLIILLVSGDIVLSLLITNFLLSLFAGRKGGETRNEKEWEAYAEIIQRVTDQLAAEATAENHLATEIVIRSYGGRSAAPKKRGTLRQETEMEKDLLAQALRWERENTLSLLDQAAVEPAAAEHYLAFLNERSQALLPEKSHNSLRRLLRIAKFLIRGGRHRSNSLHRESLAALRTANAKFVIDQLNRIRTEENSAAVDNLLSSYEIAAAIPVRSEEQRARGADSSLVFEIAMKGFQLERGLIQEMYEAGRISWETAKEMRGNILALEARLQAE